MESFVLKVVIVMAFLLAYTSAGNFNQDVMKSFGDWRVRTDKGGKRLNLSLDYSSGSGIESYKSYLFGRFDMQIKLVPGNSAGTVATFYLSSQGAKRDEIDFEFLGNSSGQPYTLHTNVYTQGMDDREQQFRLNWINPTETYHTYTILWNSKGIIFMVDNTAIRVFNNNVKYGVLYPTRQYMNMYASLWNADGWATQGGRVKTDWSKAPFTTSYQNLNINGCVKMGKSSSCDGKSKQAWQTQGLNKEQTKNLKLFRQKYMIYNYCNDVNRFHKRLPQECRH